MARLNVAKSRAPQLIGRSRASSEFDAVAPPRTLMRRLLDVAAVLHMLSEHYGPLPDLPPAAIRSDPFALVLWEQVAYLATDAVRAASFARLQREVGTTPENILDAAPGVLEAIARDGGRIAADDRAQRMRSSARTVLASWQGDARRILALPETAARRALAKFRMIGEPAADKILALAGVGTRIPLDSNALRVLARLGLCTETGDYRTTYRGAQEALVDLTAKHPAQRVRAGELLRVHGQECCRRSSPHCERCPLGTVCPSATRSQ